MNKFLKTIYYKACRMTLQAALPLWLRCAENDCFRAEKDAWYKAFRGMIREYPSVHTCKVLQGAFGKPVLPQKQGTRTDDPQSPVLICVEKNSMHYLPRFVQYYRERGIQEFIFIDNGSSDGSAEFLCAQEDVTLYDAPEAFESHRKTGWILQALARRGMNRWYLIVDGDEFLTYERMESVQLKDLVCLLEKNRQQALHVIMADMYPAYKLMDGKHPDEDFLRDYVYFDPAPSYSVHENGQIFGGMRKRVMNAELRMDKYPLFYGSEAHIWMNNHDCSGVQNDGSCKTCRGVLRHYKFLSSDHAKYQSIAENADGGYASREQVKKYVAGWNDGIEAYSAESLKYENSGSIFQLNFILPLHSEDEHEVQHHTVC